MINPNVGCRIERIRLAIDSLEHALSLDISRLLAHVQDAGSAIENSGREDVNARDHVGLYGDTHRHRPLWIKSTEEREERPGA